MACTFVTLLDAGRRSVTFRCYRFSDLVSDSCRVVSVNDETDTSSQSLDWSDS